MGAVAAHQGKLPARKEDRANFALAIIDRYDQGDSVYAIAEELGVTHHALYKLLLKYAGDEWKESASAKALAELEEAEQDIRTAPDALELTRARERTKSAQWKLERLLSRYFGQQQHAPQAQVVINIAPIRGQVIDAEADQNRVVINSDGTVAPGGDGG